MTIKNQNLNDALPKKWRGHTWGKRKQHKNWHIHHYRDEIKIVGKETDTRECKRCYKNFLLKAYTTAALRADGAYYLQKACRQCESIIRKERREIQKSAPPKPEHCECCHKKTEKLQGDHIHETLIFRGWLCVPCNTGMGKLGDSIEGILQAAIYVENDTNKIIEKLHEIYNKIFARTQ